MWKKKWLIWIVVAAGLGVVALALLTLGLVLGFFAGHADGVELPAYHTTQTVSTHPGYLRTTLTSGSGMYVNDYEEYGLRLMNPEPRPVIGQRDLGAKVCAIPGQPTTAYIAADVGGEMPAYEVFRNGKQPPFDWRGVKFREMQITLPNGQRTVLRSSDPEFLAAVVRTLGEGAPASPSTPVSASLTSLSSIALYSDQLPGLAFCPSVYFDPRGSIFLAENISIQPSKNNTAVSARWVLADQKLTEWLTNH